MKKLIALIAITGLFASAAPALALVVYGEDQQNTDVQATASATGEPLAQPMGVTVDANISGQTTAVASSTSWVGHVVSAVRSFFVSISVFFGFSTQAK